VHNIGTGYEWRLKVIFNDDAYLLGTNRLVIREDPDPDAFADLSKFIVAVLCLIKITLWAFAFDDDDDDDDDNIGNDVGVQ